MYGVVERNALNAAGTATEELEAFLRADMQRNGRVARAFSLRIGLMAIFCFAGCSSDSAQRSAFEALQEVRQQDCRKLPSVECPKRESYDDYQRERKELESK